MAGTLTISGMSAGLASGENIIGPVTLQGVSTVGQRTDVQLSTGDNTFTLPSGETVSAVAIFLGTTPATVKVRTNLDSADAGVQVAPYVGAGTPFCVIPFPTGVTSVILNASTTVTGVELVYV